ncbi:hypothetical protein NPA07_00310 [Mycoplasmopsis caviae]|uniref:AlwI restriction endonuclease n=1 Tax=Mycoplasmopsis caviae TaxID=55603 RepID=A0A3P8LI16_9BACT|nr:hypothetical protein [Mycoplasmopsis caviae]UUD35309.1 hypothetical protein NPA07_00310 [Mycoplasmopsis caviae]VDR41912.1 Uncharacterised protein [Mycoplasmopsis caviae]
MKINDFNKLGGTELRTKKQVNSYCQILYWIKDNTDEFKKMSSHDKQEDLFYKWIKIENIYKYKDDKKINRLEMLCSRLEKWKLVKKDPTTNLFFLADDLLGVEINENLIFKKIFENYEPFRETINFILNNKDRKIDTKKLFLAFACFDGSESFVDLYNKCSIGKIVSLKKDEDLKNIESYEKNLGFRKPPKNFAFYRNIYNMIKNNQQKEITTKHLTGFKTDKNYNHLYFKSKNKFVNVKEQICNRIKQMNSISEFIELIEKNKLETLLFDEYFDLFRRWLRDFTLINADEKVIDASRIYVNDIDNYPSINYENIKPTKYLWNLDKTRKILKQIQDRNWEKIKTENGLFFVENHTIAEYFVNLFFAHILNIKPQDFTKFSNTKVDYELFPKHTAPGGGSDFIYYSNDRIWSVETTIHKTLKDIDDHETTRVNRHISAYLNDFEYYEAVEEQYDTDSLDKVKLFIISFMNNENKETHLLSECISGHLKPQITKTAGWSKIAKNSEFDKMHVVNLLSFYNLASDNNILKKH